MPCAPCGMTRTYLRALRPQTFTADFQWCTNAQGRSQRGHFSTTRRPAESARVCQCQTPN